MGLALLLAGQILMSASVIFIKLSSLPAAELAAARLLGAALLLSPLYWRERRRQPPLRDAASPALKHLFFRAILPGFLLGAHFILWNMGAHLANSMQASLIVNMVPVAMPFFIFALLREKPNLWEIAGTLCAVGGLAITILLGQAGQGGDSQGMVLCILAMLLVTAYLALARINASGGLWSYVVPIYAVGGACCLAFSFLTGQLQPISLQTGELVSILGLTLGCTVAGHSINNWAMRRYPSQLVSVLSTTQFLWAGGLAWLIFAEIPPALFLPQALAVITGCLLALRGKAVPERKHSVLEI